MQNGEHNALYIYSSKDSFAILAKRSTGVLLQQYLENFKSRRLLEITAVIQNQSATQLNTRVSSNQLPATVRNGQQTAMTHYGSSTRNRDEFKYQSIEPSCLNQLGIRGAEDRTQP